MAGFGNRPRPLGVMVIALVTLAGVLVTLIGVARGTAAAGTASAPAEPTEWARRQAQIAGIWSAVGLMAAAGLFGMRRWGLVLTIVYYAGALAIIAINLPRLDQSGTNVGMLIFKVGFAILVIWYLTLADTRRAFRKA